MENKKIIDIKKAMHLIVMGDLMPIVQREKAYKEVKRIKTKYGLQNFKEYNYLLKEIFAEQYAKEK